MTDAFTWLVVRAQTIVANAREREEGQTFVEYALLLAGIAILLIVAIIFPRTGSLTCSARPVARSATRSDSDPRIGARPRGRRLFAAPRVPSGGRTR